MNSRFNVPPPPPPRKEKKCVHDFRLLRTGLEFNQFYCTKCLHIENKKVIERPTNSLSGLEVIPE